MQLRYMQMLAAMRQAPTFLDTNGDRLVTVNAGGARGALNESITNLATLAQRQSTHRVGKTGELASERRLARALRREHIKPIVRLAQMKVPEIAQLEAVRVPPVTTNSTDLVVKALSLADTVAPYTGELHLAGLPADFMEQLRAAADRVLGAIGGKGGHLRQQVGATSAIDKAVVASRRIVNAVDALVRAALGEDDSLVDEWAKVVSTIRAAANRAVQGNGQPGAAPVDGAPSTVPTDATRISATASVTAAPAGEVRSAA